MGEPVVDAMVEVLEAMARRLKGRRGMLIEREDFDRVSAALDSVRVELVPHVKPEVVSHGGQ